MAESLVQRGRKSRRRPFRGHDHPIFIGAVILILVLERIMPAKPNQAIFSGSFFQDVIWAFLEGIGQATVTLAWVMLLFRVGAV